jgi:hypothetical protein
MKRGDLIAAGLATLALTAWLVPFARGGVDAHHDGIVLKPALDVLAGQTLFLDTFTQYGALTCYVHVAALLVHPSLLCLKLLTVGAYALALFTLYAAWRMVLPRSLTLVACGLFILFIPAYEKHWLGDYWILNPWSSVLALMFQSLALYALMRIIRAEQPQRWAVVLGLAAAGVFWCRQPVGTALIATLGVVAIALPSTGWVPLHHSRREILLCAIGGLAGASLLMIAGIVLSGAGPAWWYQNFVWPRKWAVGPDTFDLEKYLEMFLHPGRTAALIALGVALLLPGWVRRLRPGISSRWVGPYYLLVAAVLVWQSERVLAAVALRTGGWTLGLPVLIFIQSVISIFPGASRRPRAADYHVVAAFAAVSLASLLQYFPVADPWHVVWSLGPGFGLCLYAIWRWSGWPPRVVAGVIVLLVLPAVSGKVAAYREWAAQPRVTLTSPAILRGLRVAPAQAQAFHQIEEALRPVLAHDPAIANLLLGNDALYLCFTANHTNPMPYFVTWPGLADAADDRKRWNFLYQVRPLLFVQQANWEAINGLYRRARYVPLAYVPSLALEIAVPQELADTLGLGPYGAERPAAPPSAKP